MRAGAESLFDDIGGAGARCLYRIGRLTCRQIFFAYRYINIDAGDGYRLDPDRFRLLKKPLGGESQLGLGAAPAPGAPGRAGLPTNDLYQEM